MASRACWRRRAAGRTAWRWGPDGAFYVCNNGGFTWIEQDGTAAIFCQPPDYSGGRIERVHAKTGAVTLLYDECAGHRLRGPNDIVFDAHGGFYFTDLGKGRARDMDHGGVITRWRTAPASSNWHTR